MEITEILKKGEMGSGSVTVRFTLTCKDGGTPEEMLGYVYNGLEMCGSLNARPDGTFGFSLKAGHGLSKEDFSGILNQLADAAYGILTGKEE